MREVHCLKVLKEPIEKGAESEFRNRIEILKRMQPAQKNGTEFAAVVEGLGEFSPLNGQRIHRGVSPLFGLLPDLYREIDQRRNPDADRCELSYRCEHFPVHSINNSRGSDSTICSGGRAGGKIGRLMTPVRPGFANKQERKVGWRDTARFVSRAIRTIPKIHRAPCASAFLPTSFLRATRN